MPGRWVTIKTFTYPHELALVEGYLVAEGVECFVRDQMTAQIHNFYSNAIGGIKLQVREEELYRALQVLRDGGFIAPEDLAVARETNPLTRFFMRIFKIKG